jgi:hypothetical protein
MRIALALIALTAYSLGSVIQTKIATHMDLIIIAEQHGGPSAQSYTLMMVAFYSCAIFATTGIAISLLTPANPRRNKPPYKRTNKG